MKKKKIVLVSIFDLTRVYYEIARSLQQSGHDVYWITTSDVWTNWLLERGVQRNDILKLIYDRGDFVSDEERESLTHQIVTCERNADITVNQVLMMDRFVLYKNKPDINEYVYLYYRDIKAFLTGRQIDVVFAEPTNLNELLTYMICRESGIKFFAPSSMRYPSDRLLFTEGYLKSNLVGGGNGGGSVTGDSLLREFMQTRIRPLYFEKHSADKVVSTGKLIRAARNRFQHRDIVNQPNLTHHPILERAGLMIRRVLHGFYLRHLMRYDDADSGGGPWAFYALHVQPESSIDVLGSYFSDQIKLIKDIRRALPYEVTLVIKEHPNFLGIRGPSFFRRLRRIPNVHLVKHDVSTFDIYARASVVITVSGTVAYEAAMLGTPAVVFSPMYFDRLSSVYFCPEIVKLKPLLEKILTGHERDYKADVKAMDELVAKSYPAYWCDPNSDPEVLDEDNLRRLREAFIDVVTNEVD